MTGEAGRLRGIGNAAKKYGKTVIKSKWDLLVALGVIFPWHPLSTWSFHQENSTIAEGLVLLKVPFE